MGRQGSISEEHEGREPALQPFLESTACHTAGQPRPCFSRNLSEVQKVSAQVSGLSVPSGRGGDEVGWDRDWTLSLEATVRTKQFSLGSKGNALCTRV
jgi:hypothetical protein